MSAFKHLYHEQPIKMFDSRVIAWLVFSVDISSMVFVGRAADACSLMIWPQANLQLSVNIIKEDFALMGIDAGERSLLELYSYGSDHGFEQVVV